MPSAADLHRAVQTTLASKRLGTPVFVRYTLQSEDRANAVLPRLARAVALVRDWLGQPLERVYAVGSIASGQVALTLEFAQGGTALVSWAQGRPRGDGVDLLVLGNHGALAHDAGSAVLWDEALAPGEENVDTSLLRVLERALGSGKPEQVAREARP